METKPTILEKKAYHTPQLTSFGSVQDETKASSHGNTFDGTPSYPNVTFSAP
jgi:hypothetical protein